MSVCLESVCDSCRLAVAGLRGTNTDDQARWCVFQYKSYASVCQPRSPILIACLAGLKSQSDHLSSVGLFLQVVNYPMLGSPQEDLVSYLDLSCGYLQGDC